MDIKYLVEFMYKGEINVEHVSNLFLFASLHHLMTDINIETE